MRYLHLSDIHFTSPEGGLLDGRIQDGLPTYLIENNIKADDVFFCGDLRNAALGLNETDAAKKAVAYLRGIAEAVGGGKGKSARIHMVPGNHDLNRGDDACIAKVKEIRGGYSPSNGAFGKDEAFLLNRFEFYRKAVGLLDEADNRVWQTTPMPLHTHGVTKDGYNVLYINTAVTCCEKAEDERGHLVVGINQIEGILAEMCREPLHKPIIALGHHALNCLRTEEHEALERLFKKHGVLLYLNGDAHSAWIHEEGDTLEITSGCIKGSEGADPVFFTGEVSDGKVKSVTAHHWTMVGRTDGKWRRHEAFNELIAEYVSPVPLNNLRVRNADFCGREEELKLIRDALTQDSIAALTQTIAGLGGVGKTQTALEYAHRHLDTYTDGVCWLDAERADTMLNSAFAFAQRAGYTGDAVPEALQPWFKSYFAGKERCLIIFDNAEPETDIAPYMPDPQRGHVLITTRNRAAKYGRVIDLDPLKLDEAVAFLCARTQREDTRGVADVAERLGRLPLALEQAAAYMRECGTPFTDYLAILEDEGLKPLRDEGTAPPDYRKIVTTTWKASIDKLGDPAAKALLNVCAYFDADQIPLGDLADYRGHLPEALRDALASKSRKNELIKALRQYSLVTRNEQTGDISIHRLVQEVIREELRDAGDLAFLDAAFGVMYVAIPREYGADPAVYDRFKRVGAHAFAVAGYYAEAYVDAKDKQNPVSNLFFDVGKGYRDVTAQYDLALSAYGKCVDICEKVFGKEHENTVTVYNSIGSVYDKKGNSNMALKWYHKALAICETALSNDRSGITLTYNNLAMAYGRRGEHDMALKWHYKALAINEKVFGTEHSRTATTYGNIAEAHRSIGEYDTALEWYHKALAIKETSLGKGHPDIAAIYNNIALAHYGKGEHDTALEWFYKVLPIFENTPGKDHPSTATTYHNIGGTYYHKGDYDTALEWFYKALPIHEQVLGKDHPSTRTTQRFIDSILSRQNPTPDA